MGFLFRVSEPCLFFFCILMLVGVASARQLLGFIGDVPFFLMARVLLQDILNFRMSTIYINQSHVVGLSPAFQLPSGR